VAQKTRGKFTHLMFSFTQHLLIMFQSCFLSINALLGKTFPVKEVTECVDEKQTKQE